MKVTDGISDIGEKSFHRNGARSKGFYYTRQKFIENTFNIDDVFDKDTMEELKNETLYEVTETNSLFYGRCFTICHLKKVHC